MALHAILGVAAGVLSLLPCPLYVRSILRGAARPNRVTWWVLAAVSALIAGSSYQIGARDTLWLPLAYVATFLVIALLSVRFGDGPPSLSRLDQVSILAAGVCAVAWWQFRTPTLALFGAVATEFAGLVPTIVKTYRNPQTEDRGAWVIATVASALNLAALDAWSPVLALYPLYVLATNAAITLLLLKPRARLPRLAEEIGS